MLMGGYLMHSAKLEHSDRLKRVFSVLSDGKRHSTRDIIRMANVCAVNSIAAELRANGIPVECEAVAGIRGRYEYWIAA